MAAEEVPFVIEKIETAKLIDQRIALNKMIRDLEDKIAKKEGPLM